MTDNTNSLLEKSAADIRNNIDTISEYFNNGFANATLHFYGGKEIKLNCDALSALRKYFINEYFELKKLIK